MQDTKHLQRALVGGVSVVYQGQGPTQRDCPKIHGFQQFPTMDKLFVCLIFLLVNSFLNLLHAINPLTMLLNLSTPFFYTTTTLSPDLTLTRRQAHHSPHLKNIIFLPQSRKFIINNFIMISNICLVVDCKPNFWPISSTIGLE